MERFLLKWNVSIWMYFLNSTETLNTEIYLLRLENTLFYFTLVIYYILKTQKTNQSCTYTPSHPSIHSSSISPSRKSISIWCFWDSQHVIHVEESTWWWYGLYRYQPNIYFLWKCPLCTECSSCFRGCSRTR